MLGFCYFVTGECKDFYRLGNGQIVMLNDRVRTKSAALLWCFFSAVVNRCVSTAGFPGNYWGQELYQNLLPHLGPGFLGDLVRGHQGSPIHAGSNVWPG